jgi:hypothetical protein
MMYLRKGKSGGSANQSAFSFTECEKTSVNHDLGQWFNASWICNLTESPAAGNQTLRLFG